jgi:hypothetical protein
LCSSVPAINYLYKFFKVGICTVYGLYHVLKILRRCKGTKETIQGLFASQYALFSSYSSALNMEQTDATGSKELQSIKPSSKLHKSGLLHLPPLYYTGALLWL